METIKIGKVKQLLTARPEGMPFDEYKMLLKQQKAFLYGFWETKGKTKVFIHGRLQGVLIPPHQYVNSQNPKIVID